MDRESLDKLVGKTIDSVGCDFHRTFQDEVCFEIIFTNGSTMELVCRGSDEGSYLLVRE
jgi:hypothetical protein